MTMSIHDCLINIEKRAERADDQKLVETFVDAAPLYASVSSTDHQIIFGRRGTGKTHALKFLFDAKIDAGDIAVYIDLRAVGSNGSIYNDREKSYSQRATPLLMDVLQEIHEELLTVAIELSEETDLSKVGPSLDYFADAISTVEIVETVETITDIEKREGKRKGSGVKFGIGLEGVNAGVEFSSDQEFNEANKSTKIRSGRENYYLRFGDVHNRLKTIVTMLGKRVWILLDEWSVVPLDLQPYLADLFRRCVFPIGNVTVKIGAIEHRFDFIIRNEGGYTGIELGADAGADVNLDDFLVFDNDATRAMEFFSNLLFKHYRATDGLVAEEGPQTVDDFISQTFTQITAFEEFVRAVEGVPRDAVYLASMVARRAYGKLLAYPLDAHTH